MISPVSSIEPLEARIAPASVVFHSATDSSKTVTLTSNVGTATELMALVTAATATGTTFPGSELELSLALAGHAKFNHADFSLTTAGGATVLLHSFDATGFDLGAVTVRGDLDKLLAGDTNLATPAVKSLDIDSLGLTSQAASTIHGSIGTLTIAHDLAGTLTLQTKAGSIGTGTIFGDLNGCLSSADGAGSIFAGGNLGRVQVIGQLLGGAGAKSGSLFVSGSIGSVFAYTLAGGVGAFSGSVHADGNIAEAYFAIVTGSTDQSSHASNASLTTYGLLGSITVGGKLTGGFAASSGQIAAALGIRTALLQGGLVGGNGFESGSIGAAGPIGDVLMGNNTVFGRPPVDLMTGGAGEKSGSVLGSTSIASVSVLGNIIGGAGAHSAEIASAGTLGFVLVAGDVRGGNLGAGSGAIGSIGALGDVEISDRLVGGQAASSGQIVSATSIHSVRVDNSVIGGDGVESGAIGSLGPIGAVTVVRGVHGGGDVLGGGSYHSGSILSAKSIGKVTISGGLIGLSTSESSGEDAVVYAGRSLGSITVGGDVHGGNLAGSGVIEAGALPSVTIHGNIIGGGGQGSGAVLGLSSVGYVTVDGDVRAGTADQSGVISSRASIRSVTIGGSLDGTTSGTHGTYSGAILAETTARLTTGNPNPFGVAHNIATVVIKGSILGGDALSAGSIVALGDISSVTVGTPAVNGAHPASAPAVVQTSGNIDGGSQELTGVIMTNGNFANIGTVTVAGSILGGTGEHSGAIFAETGAIGKVHISSDLSGGAGPSAGFIFGFSIAEVTIGGNFMGGQYADAGYIEAGAASLGKLVVVGEIGAPLTGFGPTIAAALNIGSIEAGSISGRTTDFLGPSDIDVQIVAAGNGNARTAAQALAIGSITVHTTMSYTTVWAGEVLHVPGLFHGGMSIGTIEVGRDAGDLPAVWTGNRIIAGATSDDLAATDAPSEHPLLSQVAKVIIHGRLGATPDESYAVVADYVGSVTANSVALNLHPGARNDLTSFGGTTDPSGSTAFYEIGARRT